MKTSSRPGSRLARASLLGLLLFAAGYGVYESGLIADGYRLFGGHAGQADSPPPYSRAQMEADRKAYAKSASAAPPRMPVGSDGYYLPPPEDALPKGPHGEAVKRGRDIFTQTGAYVKDHVGNAMACANCHLDAGRRENSAPMWAAYGAYPAYRAKTGSISTLEDRIQGCFMYSMNAQHSPSGHAPEAGSDVYRDLITYMAWLADGAPAGEKLRGALYPKITKPKEGYDLGRGLAVYQQNCALCHGEQGQGTRDAQGQMKFPPLWGAESYNWGAGMARIDTAAGFIKANMPMGKPYSLSDQQAWDVAAFINSHERPKDPRQTGTVEAAARDFHAGEESYYGKMLKGHLLGTGVVASR
ncbi:c-type cytochrome [Bordetella hinzii]|uniref:c-type cytochrome n=1 Tax=Bordetella hinzii TaxID=103855 RepID=UPI0039FD611D